MSFVIAAVRRPAIPALTSLRFFAALWVVLFHVNVIGLNRGGSVAYLAFSLLGYAGVSFFFVLSGFILVYVYADRKIQKRGFWQARFARIYPAYIFSLVVMIPALISFWPMTKQAHMGLLALIANPILLEAWFPKLLLTWNPVGWSLSAEAFFYLVCPASRRSCPPRHVRQSPARVFAWDGHRACLPATSNARPQLAYCAWRRSTASWNRATEMDTIRRDALRFIRPCVRAADLRVCNAAGVEPLPHREALDPAG
jgi:hypothetical protein